MKERDPRVSNTPFYNIMYEYIRHLNIPKPDNVERYADLFEVNAVLHTLIDFKATKCSQIKPMIYRVKDSGAERAFRELNGQDLGGNLSAYMEKKEAKDRGIEEVNLDSITVLDKEYRLKKMLTKPNAQNRWDDFMYSISAFYDIAGWSLIYGAKLSSGEDAGKYAELYSMPTHMMEIIGRSPLDPVTQYIYNGDNRIPLNAKDCVPIRSFSVRWDKAGTHLYGTSKVKAAWFELMTYIESKERQYTSFKTGDSAHIIFPEFESSQLMSDDDGELRRFKDKIFGALRQKDRHAAAIVGQKLGAINLSSALNTSQTIEAQQEIRDILAALWKLPPRLVFNDSRSATYNNMNEDKKNALYNGVFPFLFKVEQALNEDIVQPLYGYRLAFDYDIYPELLPNITDDMVKLDKVSYLTDDEKRAYFRYEPLKDGLGEVPTKYQHIAVQNGGNNVVGPTPGLQQNNGAFNRGTPAERDADYEKRTDNQD